MKIVFFASAAIAVPTLQALIEHKHDVRCVVTSPDSKKGRHLSISGTPVKEYAFNNNLAVYQPADLRSKDTIEKLKKIDADLFIVFAYGKILPASVLEIPKKYPLNIHASLLPKYRGAAPINWALINGEPKTGVSIIKMNDSVDEGDIFLQRELSVDDYDNAITLTEKIAHLGSELIIEALERIGKNAVTFKAQQNSFATSAPKLKKADGRINWDSGAEQIRNLVRGCIPWPGAFTFLRNSLVKIWECDVVDSGGTAGEPPGTITSLKKDAIIVSTNSKQLIIKELQMAGAKRLSAQQFIPGHRLKEKEVFK